MTVARKYITLLMLQIFIILPIVLGTHIYHGYDSYQEYYNSPNNEQLKSVSIPEKITEESYYNPNNDKEEKIKSRFTDLSLSISKLENNFVFPEEFQARNGRDHNNAEILIPSMIKCNHKNETFCEDVLNYPIEFVNQALSMNSSLIHYAHKDIISIVSRVDTDEETLCLSTEQVIHPKAGLNIENKWLYILQSNQTNFYQSIRVETCQEINTRCKLIDGFAEGYVTTCKQKYIYRELSAISEDGKIIRDYFRFPASCCCHVQFQADDNIE